MNKKKIAVIAFIVILVAGLGGIAVYGFVKAENYKRNMQYGYTRSLSDLRDSVDNIETTLNKAVYANTATEQNGLTEKLMRESSIAKVSLSALPLTDNSMDNVSKFISQVGDFSMSLSKKISEGGNITSNEYKTIQSLENYSKKLKKDLADVKPDFSGSSFNDSLEETSRDFANFPSLIYDGPFSDNVGRKTAKLTEGKKSITVKEAQMKAAVFLNTTYGKINYDSDTKGTLPTYNFTANNGAIRICVTKADGYISEMSNSRNAGQQKLDYASASKKAGAFLESRGIHNMKESYYAINDGICLINYAFMQNGVICYPDLIKVGIALDNGEIVRFQSAGYITNHKNRSLKAKLTEQEAEKKVSPNLKVEKSCLAVIPTPGMDEILCYEFQCHGNNGDKVLVYINACNGFEENILILQFSDNGVLVR